MTRPRPRPLARGLGAPPWMLWGSWSVAAAFALMTAGWVAASQISVGVTMYVSGVDVGLRVGAPCLVLFGLSAALVHAVVGEPARERIGR